MASRTLSLYLEKSTNICSASSSQNANDSFEMCQAGVWELLIISLGSIFRIVSFCARTLSSWISYSIHCLQPSLSQILPPCMTQAFEYFKKTLGTLSFHTSCSVKTTRLPGSMFFPWSLHQIEFESNLCWQLLDQALPNKGNHIFR